MSTSAPEKIIGGRRFSFGTIPPDPDGIELEMMLLRTCGDQLLKFFGEFVDREKSDLESAESKTKFMQEIATVLQSVLPVVVQRLHAKDHVQPDGARVIGLLSAMNMTFKHVRCEGQPLSMEMFNSRPGKEKYVVFFEALKANFAGFFGDGLSTSLPA